MRDHICSCGQVTGFLSHYRALSKGELIQSAETVFTDYCLECEHYLHYFSSPLDEREHQRLCAQCERYQLFMEGWRIGQGLAQLTFETADLSLIETIGDLAGWTTRCSPRSYRGITAEQDAADGGLQGEVWRHFITSWRLAGGDRRRKKGV